MPLLNKRKIERYELSIPALIIFDTEQEKEPVEHITRDISSKGAFFYVDHSIQIGSGCKVDLVLPNQVHIKVAGTIIRSAQNGIAVCFDNKYQIFSSKN
jgi:hypothetical protein